MDETPKTFYVPGSGVPNYTHSMRGKIIWSCAGDSRSQPLIASYRSAVEYGSDKVMARLCLDDYDAQDVVCQLNHPVLLQSEVDRVMDSLGCDEEIAVRWLRWGLTPDEVVEWSIVAGRKTIDTTAAAIYVLKSPAMLRRLIKVNDAERKASRYPQQDRFYVSSKNISGKQLSRYARNMGVEPDKAVEWWIQGWPAEDAGEIVRNGKDFAWAYDVFELTGVHEYEQMKVLDDMRGQGIPDSFVTSFFQ